VTVVHVPSDPTMSQAWHCPVQSVSQHTPSTQKSPDTQSLVWLQVPRWAMSGRHFPATQWLPEAQFESCVQPVH
jgi:hypothetical protein